MILAKSEINHVKDLMVDLEDWLERLERLRKLKDAPA
jgi:hypothetical protein